jgi:hypothetical protein
MEGKRSMQRAPDCTEPGQKTVQPTKANDNVVSLDAFRSARNTSTRLAAA